ncbi:MAG TPA: choice-of-anchor Q domain-containing protein, partial [Kiritimatiellia bacterium]
PQFVDPDAGDYHLAAVSPCIDAGDSTNAPDADLEGTARPQDGDGSSTAEFDIGAYEYVSP